MDATVRSPSRVHFTATLQTHREAICGLPQVEGSGADSNATTVAAPPPPPPAMEIVTKTRRKSVRVPLKIGGPGFVRPGMTAEQRKVCLLAIAVPKRPALAVCSRIDHGCHHVLEIFSIPHKLPLQFCTYSATLRVSLWRQACYHGEEQEKRARETVRGYGGVSR